MAENESYEVFESADDEALGRGIAAEAAEAETERAENGAARDGKGPLFTLRFRIPAEDYIVFHKIIGADAVKKARRKTVLLGWVEFAFGAAFLASLFMSKTEGGPFYYFLIAVMILMGLYGILYYRVFYPKSLSKVLTRQHAETPYLQNEIQVDLYRDKLTERSLGKEQDTAWKSISDVKITGGLYMIMLESKRCLLIPRGALSASQDEAVGRLLKEVCAEYGKPRYEL